MDDHEMQPDAPIDPADALSHVQDDESAIHEARLWAADELVNGRSPEELLSQMLSEGWQTDQAEQIIETARQETRQERGVTTRDDIIRDLNADYRRATGGLSVAFRSGIFGLYGFTTGFMAALRSARRLKRILRGREESEGRNSNDETSKPPNE